MRKSLRRNLPRSFVMGSLPESYDNFLKSLNARNTDDLDWENVKGLLIEESLKRAEKNKKQESDNALYARRGGSLDRGRYPSPGGTGRGRGYGTRFIYSASPWLKSKTRSSHMLQM